MLVTDLDGTLLDRQGTLSPRTDRLLRALGAIGVARVVATGRSPFSFRKAVTSDMPIDYAILSSGVGILTWPQGRQLRTSSLVRHEIQRVASTLRQLGLDFMLHHPFPDNHRFHYHRSTDRNEDFERRVELYADHATPLAGKLDTVQTGAQFIAVLDEANGERMVQKVRALLPELSTLRTTSPLDHRSTWIEIFPKEVDKAAAASWLAERLGIERKNVLGIGNDYNDLHLLEWAGTSRVVANAPTDLRARFAVTASNDEDGVVQAVEAWLKKLGLELSSLLP